MPSTMNGSELLVVVFTLVMGTQVFAEAACSLRSNSNCTQVTTPVPLSTNQEPVQPANAGSCNFKHETCGYKQGCRENGGAIWTHNSTEGYFQMKAITSGNFGKLSVLESPFLNISTTSCLRFTASFKIPVRLTVLLSGVDRPCTVFPSQSREGTQPESLQLPPIGAAKVLFQGIAGGDTIHSVLIYTVTVDVGCCQDPEWSNVKDNVKNKPNRPDCHWSVSNGWVFNPPGVAMLDKTGSVRTLTTPLIRATTPGFSDSIAFEYSLSDDEDNVLNVFMVELHNVPRLLWTSEKQNNSSTGHSNYLKGDVTVSSSTAFQIRFTGKRETASSVVAIRNVQYIRKTTPLASEPPADQGHSNAGATTGGVIVAVLIVLAIAIGGFIFWRRRNTQRDHQETDPHNSPDTATPLPHADEPSVSPENYERLNAVSEQREYAVLQAAARQPTDSTYYELPSGEGPAVAGTAGRNPNYQNLPVPENGLSDTANAGSAEGGDGSNNDYLTPVLTMPAAVNTASK